MCAMWEGENVDSFFQLVLGHTAASAVPASLQNPSHLSSLSFIPILSSGTQISKPASDLGESEQRAAAATCEERDAPTAFLVPCASCSFRRAWLILPSMLENAASPCC